jgi:hypothetical protein
MYSRHFNYFIKIFLCPLELFLQSFSGSALASSVAVLWRVQWQCSGPAGGQWLALSAQDKDDTILTINICDPSEENPDKLKLKLKKKFVLFAFHSFKVRQHRNMILAAF